MIAGLTSIIFPTTGRTLQAVHCLAGLLATVDRDAVELVVVVDNADRGSAEAIRDALLLLRTGVYLRCPIFMLAKRAGPVAAWNAGARRANGEYLMLAADDLDFRPGWLDAALAAMGTLPGGWGIVGLNDGHHDGTEPFTPHYLAHRRACIEVLGGVLAIPGYRHVWFDYEVKARAVAAGRYVWAKDAVVVHKHPDFGTRARDAQDMVKAAHAEADRLRYLARQAAGWPNDYVPVITEEPWNPD